MQLCHTSLTKLYRKKTTGNLIPIKTPHPKTLKQRIQYWQVLRLKRICTTKEDFTEQALSNALTKQLVEKGYNENEIQ